MSVRARIRVGANSDSAVTISMDQHDIGTTTNSFPAKEWCILDDVLNVSDSASVTIANVDGENTGKFQVGQRIEIDESDSNVAQGNWIRQFTGIITSLDSYSDIHGGSNILISAMDLGWNLTSSHANPLTKKGSFGVNLNGITWDQLLKLLLDPSWGFGTTVGSNGLNRSLKQGRAGVLRSLLGPQAQFGSVLPYIQIEPGQSPWDILQTYAAREGVLINVGASGDLIFFRPDYTQQASYSISYNGSKDSSRVNNNILGRPSLHEDINGLYSEVQCWSSVINPVFITGENPNASSTHFTFTPSQNPLPFIRRQVITDGEAISSALRKNRAIWKQQIGLFESWQYEIELLGHSQVGSDNVGHFFVSDTIISINDTIHDVVGGYYVQQVRRSSTLQDGLKTKLVIRKPGLLNPELTKFSLGAGTKKGAQQKAPQP